MSQPEIVATRVNEGQAEWSHDQWLDSGRQWWKASAGRIIDCTELLVLNAENRVMAVGRIAGVERDLEGNTGRVSIMVRPLPDHQLIGRVINRPASRNPVVYLTNVEVLN